MTTAPGVAMLHASGQGRFLPPTGAISVGSTFTITDDTKYNAWPVACRLANGSILLAYTKADTHHQDNTGNAVGKLSTDEGATWGSEFTIYDHASLWAAVYGVMQTSTGRIIATLWRDNWNVSGTGEAGIVYSDDHGSTWSSWIALTSSLSQDSYGTGPAVQLANGDLLVTVEGTASGAIINRSCHTLKSTDNGATWGSEVTVRNYVTDTRPYYESKLVAPSPGSSDLLCVHRTSAGTGTHYVSKSTDSGATWGTPYAITDGYAAPSTLRIHHGMLLFATRRNSDDSVIAYTSTDAGATFGHGTVVDATMNEMEYACPVQLLDGRILLFYGTQPSSSTSNADIKAAYLTVS